ncbi:MAG: hypothetical protein NVV82_15580 [Sporocytophaga sp.]|nr:hypothetical protein [Sporocytophaga sp.]
MKLIKEGWCIWMETPTQESMDEEIGFIKSQLKKPFKESRNEIEVSGVQGIKVTFEDSNGRYYERIFFTKFNTLFIITNKNKANADFEKFYKSILINKTK